MPRETAGEVIRAHRKAKGLTLRELARVSKVAHSTIHRLESGQDCKASVLSMLADALKLEDEQRLRLLSAAK